MTSRRESSPTSAARTVTYHLESPTPTSSTTSRTVTVSGSRYRPVRRSTTPGSSRSPAPVRTRSRAQQARDPLRPQSLLPRVVARSSTRRQPRRDRNCASGSTRPATCARSSRAAPIGRPTTSRHNSFPRCTELRRAGCTDSHPDDGFLPAQHDAPTVRRRPRPPGAQLRLGPRQRLRASTAGSDAGDADVPDPAAGRRRLPPLLPVHAKPELYRPLEWSGSGPRTTPGRRVGQARDPGHRVGMDGRSDHLAGCDPICGDRAEAARVPDEGAPRPPCVSR